MAYRFIKLNKARCLVCKDILISPPDKPEKLITCNCGGLTISGGATSLVRTAKKGTYENLSQWDFTGCPEVNTNTPMPPPGSKITAREIEDHKRKLNEEE
jgi:hypothetical protein